MRVPTLPIINLLILLAWTALMLSVLVKMVAAISAIDVGLQPMDLVVLAGVLLLFAIALIGRSWVIANDPAVLAEQRANATLDAYQTLRGASSTPSEPTAGTAAEPARSGGAAADKRSAG